MGQIILATAIIGGLLLFLALPGSFWFLLVSVFGLIVFYQIFGLRYLCLIFAAIVGCLILARNTELLILAVIIGGIFLYHFLPDSSHPPGQAEPPQTPTDRLRILEDAYRQNLITEQEYLEKRQQILAEF